MFKVNPATLLITFYLNIRHVCSDNSVCGMNIYIRHMNSLLRRCYLYQGYCHLFTSPFRVTLINVTVSVTFIYVIVSVTVIDITIRVAFTYLT